ncbi:MAG: glucokinase [Burkholderiales bacterium]
MVRQPAAQLLADIGGTSARFALSRDGRVDQQQTQRCSESPGLLEAARSYLDLVGASPTQAAFAVAAPVLGGQVKMTNSAWTFSIEATREALGLERLLVVNDFTALAHAIPMLGQHELRQVGEGSAARGAPVGVIGPGTGLGVSGLIPVGDRWAVLQGEGGHCSFAPRSNREDALLRVLRARFGHVSFERLASGPGLSNIYQALCELDGAAPVELPPEAVTAAAQDGSDQRAEETLDLFCAALGTAAADLALAIGARAGVYIGGGIVPRLGERFAKSPFRERFEDHGRFSAYLAGIPTFVIIAEHPPALRGLAALLDSP